MKPKCGCNKEKMCDRCYVVLMLKVITAIVRQRKKNNNNNESK